MNILIETLGLIVTILSVVGVVYNNRRDLRCFGFWIVSNGIMCLLHVYVGLWSMVVRDLIFFVLSIQGYRMWGKLRKELKIENGQLKIKHG
jgi:nicotinamide riboside transporter PnuC